MRGLASRIGRLETKWNPSKEPRSVFRVVISAIAQPLNWEGSKCTRTLGSDGTLLEVLVLDGCCRDVSHGELDEFVGRYPVQPGVGYR
jgi:hypothetical protein